MNEVITIGIADAAIARQPCILVTYALGSCVGVCLYEKKRRIGGMVHILLPNSSAAIERSNPCKFADSGCEYLLQRMLFRGAQQSFVTAKIVGGATMFAVKGPMPVSYTHLDVYKRQAQMNSSSLLPVIRISGFSVSNGLWKNLPMVSSCRRIASVSLSTTCSQSSPCM